MRTLTRAGAAVVTAAVLILGTAGIGAAATPGTMTLAMFPCCK